MQRCLPLVTSHLCYLDGRNRRIRPFCTAIFDPWSSKATQDLYLLSIRSQRAPQAGQYAWFKAQPRPRRSCMAYVVAIPHGYGRNGYGLVNSASRWTTETACNKWSVTGLHVQESGFFAFQGANASSVMHSSGSVVDEDIKSLAIEGVSDLSVLGQWFQS